MPWLRCKLAYKPAARYVRAYARFLSANRLPHAYQRHGYLVVVHNNMIFTTTLSAIRHFYRGPTSTCLPSRFLPRTLDNFELSVCLIVKSRKFLVEVFWKEYMIRRRVEVMILIIWFVKCKALIFKTLRLNLVDLNSHFVQSLQLILIYLVSISLVSSLLNNFLKLLFRIKLAVC